MSKNLNNVVPARTRIEDVRQPTSEDEARQTKKVKIVTKMNQKEVSARKTDNPKITAQLTNKEKVGENQTHGKEKKWNRKEEQDSLLKNEQVHSVKLDERQIRAALYNLERPPYLLMPLFYLCHLCWRFLRRYRVQITFFQKPKKKSYQNLERTYVKSILGLIFGLSLGFMTYFLFMITFSGNPHISTIISAYIMLVSVFGLAFSRDFQCITLLTFPYLIATRLRWAILIYVTGMSFSGPVLNFLHNSGNFRNSIACIIAQVNTNMMLLKKLTQAPLYVLKDQLGNIVSGINTILNHLKNLLSKITFSIIRLTNVMKSQSSWTRSLSEACGDKVALINQCLAFFNNIYFSCTKSLGIFRMLCKFVRFFAKDTCVASEKLTSLCKKQSSVLVDTLDITTKTDLMKQHGDIINLIGNENVTIFGNVSEIEGVVFENTISNKLKQRMDNFVRTIDAVKSILSWVLVAWTLFTMFLLVVQAAIFKKIWLTRSAYDNFYITEEFIKQEVEAFKRGLVPTVPLIGKEKSQYKTLWSFTWTTSEKQTAAFTTLMLLTWSTSIILIMLNDYAMYQIFNIVSVLFSYDISDVENYVEDHQRTHEGEMNDLYIDSDSSFASIIQALMNLMNPLKNIALNVDASICQPTLTSPNFYTYGTICLLLGVSFLSIIFQVYIMRLRHVIMIWYYPKGAAKRAAWLRIHIRSNRGLYSRVLHKIRTIDITQKHRSQKLSRIGRFLSRNPRLAYVLRLFGIRRVMCAFCGSDGNPAKKIEFKQNFTRCVECGVYYCRLCQITLDHVCLICGTPMFSMSVEVDFEQYSTDEEKENINARYFRMNTQSSVVSSDKSDEKKLKGFAKILNILRIPMLKKLFVRKRRQQS
ncbi:unnamed protein product [Schistosoma turkestanicum]|nr:unnamed protein product [Schistosoma turkestanicum]